MEQGSVAHRLSVSAARCGTDSASAWRTIIPCDDDNKVLGLDCASDVDATATGIDCDAGDDVTINGTGRRYVDDVTGHGEVDDVSTQL